MRLQATLTQPQAEFFTSRAKYPAFVGGFGSGKSETLAQRAIADAAHSAAALIGIYAPTYDLLRLVNMTRIEVKLHEHGIRHKLHTQDKAIYTSHPGFGDFIFRTMDTPERIVGYETFTAHADELDTLKAEHARTAWNQIIARNRQVLPIAAKNRAAAYTTPEGFRFVHDRWVVNATPDYQIYRAPTHSNPFLPRDYIDGLRASYPSQLIDAYIEGQFVNLTSGSVYSSYDRHKCESSDTIRPGEQLYIGQDFNVGAMFSAVMVRRVDGYHAVDELAGVLDTPSLIRVLKERFEGHEISIYPDASGGSRKTVEASRTDLSLLRDAGFRVVVNARNPAVRDRIVSVNHAFESKRLWVNSKACPTLAAALEQQAYATNGEPDKEGGFDHACFAPDQLVWVNGSLMRFDKIPPTGQVLGADGMWHSYVNGGKIKKDQRTLLVTLSNGDTIRSTPDHRFLTDRGWLRADQLKGRALWTQSSLAELSKNSGVKGSTSAAITSRSRALGCIVKFGRILMEKYLPVITSTTGTETRLTTACATSNLCAVPTMSRIMAESALRYLKPLLTLRESGTDRMRGVSGIVSNTSGRKHRSTKNDTNIRAWNAAKDSQAACAPRQRFVEETARRTTDARAGSIMRAEFASNVARALSSTNIQRRNSALAHAAVCIRVQDAPNSDVYCLTVPDAGMFQVSGVVASNCDACGYFVVKEIPVRKPDRAADTVSRAAAMQDYLPAWDDDDLEDWKVM